MKSKDVDLFDRLEKQIEATHREVGLLARKKPDGPVNKFKLKLINELLVKVNRLLEKDYLPFDDFRTFDETDLPTASDVILVLSQYLQAIEKFREDNIE
jgi:hypothetical protein